MFDFLKKLFGDRNERELRKLWPIVHKVNEYAEQFKALSDEELRAKTDEFKRRIKEAVADIEARKAEIEARLRGEVPDISGDGHAEVEELSPEERERLYEELDDLEKEWLERVERQLDELLPEAFAVVKEACRRMLGKEWMAGGQKIVWDMVPYDVQILGGIVLHQGKIAEMKTGEGKTLVAVMPVYLNALAGRGVHVVTVNPYLAQRDAEWMGPIYEFLGLTVDVIDKYEPHSEGRRRAYQADITYGTNNEFGFDYLRDHSFVIDPDQLVQRGHHYAIVDEVDSVLIDEARTPLIISGPVPQSGDERFTELKPVIEKLVYLQQRLVAQLVAEAEQKLKERDKALEAGDRKRASELEEEAGLALLRAARGFPRNKRFMKLKTEPGVETLLQRTEAFYLQDNAKNMPFVDEVLYFALDEKNHTIELTEKGLDEIARIAGQDRDMFVLPDLGEETARLEQEYREKLRRLEEELAQRTDLSEEKRQNKLENDRRLLHKELEEQKRELYNRYAERAERLHAVEQLLRAYTLYERDVEYIVQDGKVLIVDEHTGRVLPGRRYSDGLHQAIEAKEGVKVQAATQTYATITLQNYFRMYHKLAGMTGTAVTEAEEFYKIYGLDVIVIPTHKPVIRVDHEDLVFRTKREKYNAVIQKIKEYHRKGQPVLVGTTSVEVSEMLSRMLKREGIPHNVLNARRDRAKQEALIVAQAGQKGAVTIATNMAGRGTDIKLGPGVKELGGLAIIGTERHESRRIDLQLRGRAGRQGDPGESQFYVSLEDDLMRLFGSERIARVMDRLKMEEGEVITHPWVTKSIERAQKKVEQNNFAIRKRQLEFDDVLDAQRRVVYSRRRHALTGERISHDVLEMLRDVLGQIVERHYREGDLEGLRDEVLRTFAFDFEMTPEEFARLGDDGVFDRLYQAALDFYRRKRQMLAEPFYERLQAFLNQDGLEQKPDRVVVDFTDGRRVLRAVARVDEALRTRGQEINNALERAALLHFIDEHWTEHLRELDELKEGINLRAFGQRDPLVEYKVEGFKLFQQTLDKINRDAISFIFRAGPLVETRPAAPVSAPRRRLDPSRARTQHESVDSYGVRVRAQSPADSAARRDPTVKEQPVVVGEKIGRNDPCPCGSGKKYKHCCGRNR
ncbi:preprotein translocase subunit SecA [Rhodothermus marinus]|uniref:Protein translocase subunit SecA n=2 Tax=Pseudomonadati TaxID=3379134 RepID=D0ME49_RHOM4|nr:preprotein translocase subunit SecA [Rhodothermus marinus]ACY47273.1 preprotein translocase, SecA subunit [Rhodothermus marinus DSM 4252]